MGFNHLSCATAFLQAYGSKDFIKFYTIPLQAITYGMLKKAVIMRAPGVRLKTVQNFIRTVFKCIGYILEIF
jgi:hypothetical protein